MKKTLALLIAVLMVVAMLPMSILTAAGEDGDDLFAVYDTGDALVGTYATLAEADAALNNGYTLKLLQDYTADATYEWGGARADAEPIAFTVDGDEHVITFDGADDEATTDVVENKYVWVFGNNCAGDMITLQNVGIESADAGIRIAGVDSDNAETVMMVSVENCMIVADGVAVDIAARAMVQFEGEDGVYGSATAEAVLVTGEAAVAIMEGTFTSTGNVVVRTAAGAAGEHAAALMIYNGHFKLIFNPEDNTQTPEAVVTNGNGGDVFVYGGIFLNFTENAASEYTLKHTAAANDFKIYGGVMMATGFQKGFYKPADTSASDGVSLPRTELPIIKGVTASQNILGREVYYTSYGAAEGDALLVPMLAPAARPVIGEDGNTLAFVTNISLGLADALQTWARAKAVDAGVAANEYELDLGTLIITEDKFMEYGGSFEAVAATEYRFEVIAGEGDLVEKANGDFEFAAVVPEEIPAEWKEMRFVAVPFIELTIDGIGTERFYGEFDMTTGITSMADVAAIALRDNAASAVGAYQYPSIMVAQAFSRYTEAEQQVLVEYLAHEHEYNFRGECADEDCDAADICGEIAEGIPGVIFAENGAKYFYELTLEEGVRYAIDFYNIVANYQLFDEEGNACTITNGMFTAPAAGTYYLQVNTEKLGTGAVIYSHIHNVDYLGDCDVCEENVAQELLMDANNSTVAVKGNTYVLRVDLVGGVSYAMRGINGSFTLYNAAGEAQTVTNNAFVCPEEGTGTYYITFVANYSGKITMQVAHVHQYDYKGVCAVCGDDLGVELGIVYSYSEPQRVKLGDQLYYSIRLEEGKTYKIVAKSYLGSYKLYDAAGVEQTLTSGSTFACTADGVYYLKVLAQTSTEAQVRFEVEHECTYNNTGKCEFQHVAMNEEQWTISCGMINRLWIEDEKSTTATVKAGSKSYFALTYASKGVTYNIKITGAVNYAFYNASGAALTGLTEVAEDGVVTVTYTAAADADIYLVLENTADAAAAVSIAVQHVHQIDHRGQCTVKNTTTGKTPSACREKQVTSLTANTAANVVYTATGIYRYQVMLTAGVEYRVALENAEVTWKLYNADGDVLYSSEDPADCYIPTGSATCYLVVTATADSTGTEQAPATLLVAGHSHTFNNKGECNGEDCDQTYRKKVVEAGFVYDGFLTIGDHYFNVAMEEGYVYELTFTADGVTYKLYGGENADVEMTLTDGAFTCTETGTYYYVVTVAEEIPAHETYVVEVNPVA